MDNASVAAFPQMIAALDAAERSLEQMTLFRVKLSNVTGNPDAPIGMALGGAIHHLRSAALLARNGRLLSAQALLRAAFEHADACWYFKDKPHKGAKWEAEPDSKIDHEKSRTSLARMPGGHVDEGCRKAFGLFYGQTSKFAHPCFGALRSLTYLQLPDKTTWFDVPQMSDSPTCRSCILFIVAGVSYTWNILANIYADDEVRSGHTQAYRDWQKASADLGFPVPQLQQQSIGQA